MEDQELGKPIPSPVQEISFRNLFRIEDGEDPFTPLVCRAMTARH